MIEKKTIIAPATASGRGGISVIRMSGPRSEVIAQEMCGQLADPWRFKRCEIISGENLVIDSCMVVFFKSPHSYTGDDVIEFHCHGNPTIVNLVIETAIKLGAVVAEPGEFTKTAFLNDKIDLAQAESVADLINAQSESAVIAANSSLTGKFSDAINNILDELTAIRVFVEANIDFPEEDIDKSLLNTCVDRLKSLSDQTTQLISSAVGGVKLRDGYSVAIVGPPNAGKSTLLNLLARENVAITSDIPGTTRDLVKVPVNLDGVLIEFIDTAGMRDNPENEIEKEGINRSREVIEKSNLSLVVQDANRIVEFDFGMEDFISVYNKCDLYGGQKKNGEGVFYITATTGQGVPELLKGLVNKLDIDEGQETAFLSRQRHVSCLTEGGLRIDESLTSLEEGQGLELVAENLKNSHRVLGEILRPLSSDDLLGEIFSEFCIGK
ncbi:tRNA uridine-5-carboxymethylaminomethyl(34) synthesis GTPase MnmE [Gammaproteobacteria bacterium]|nr:tRNA uridine-5-carboxymethylaminomethyl(34) synthesis GTPase MnmE [Gammaproteobacteria bacterium]